MKNDLGPNHRVNVAAARLSPKADVLDVGAGHGFLRDFVDGYYLGTDLSVDLLAGQGDRVVANALHLPVRNESFDAVSCISVLQYVVDVEAALDEFRRVLRPGGQLLLLVPNIGYLRNRAKLAAGRFPWSSKLDSWREGTVRYFAVPDFVPLLHRQGWRVRGISCSGRLHRLRSYRPQLLGADLLFDLERP